MICQAPRDVPSPSRERFHERLVLRLSRRIDDWLDTQSVPAINRGLPCQRIPRGRSEGQSSREVCQNGVAVAISDEQHVIALKELNKKSAGVASS